ncbi:MAG: UDP-N-acetylglucosamine--N-acetylmuramyl-(pentapeptide) pyrophosphoryl-undecaprenol N-acetylglucosamine transferase, partial [Eubacteriales bacterium]|nr:UDP-N-acetylglucosamine--N-acetylmuramyl-(pentapeptide) pyrophosphoryl-undecaprenol N-acetylglucosamine transferase [Eubacteriales bacterium]
TPKNIRALVKAYTSVKKAKKLIGIFNPDVVIGTGGYASWPYVKAAAMLKIPTLIQEQNVFPGVTTKKLSRYVDTVCVSYDESRCLFGDEVQKKLVLTGNPVKANNFDREAARKKLGLKEDDIYILSCGGSLGADKVNALCIEAMEIYKNKPEIKQIHAVGHIGWEKHSALARAKGLDKREGYEIVEYIYDMPLRQAAADIVVSRAGAITTAELACLGRATIFIPSPNVTEDHQYKNAAVLKKAGAAEVFRESVLDGRILAKTIIDLSKDGEKRRDMEEKMKAFGKPDAVKKITDEIFKLV